MSTKPKQPHILTIGKTKHLCESKLAATQEAAEHFRISKATGAEVLAMTGCSIIMEAGASPQQGSGATDGSAPL